MTLVRATTLGLAALLGLCGPAMADPGALPAPVAGAFAAAAIPNGGVSVFVQEVGAAKPRLAFNAQVPRNPASVMKLVTTWAALEQLGPAWTWKTEAYAEGNLSGEVLDGNLVLRGHGDPQLDLERFWGFLRRLRQSGLREIRGDLVLDGSWFEPSATDPGAFDGRPYRAYNIPPEAMAVGGRVVSVRLTPDAPASKVKVAVDPQPARLDLVNDLALVPGACGDWRGALGLDVRWTEGVPRVALRGSYAGECGERTLLLNLYDNPAYVLGVFRELWNGLGGRFQGAVRAGSAPAGSAPLAVHESPPLADAVRSINKFSNNTMARQLLLTLGAAHSGPPGNPAKGAAVVRATLAARGIDLTELVIENGAGLSRAERISARGMGRMLLAAYGSPVMPEFVSSMPVIGADGTMRRRLNGDAVAGRGHVKTGYLDGVRTLAGYVLDGRGRRWVVVCFINHANAGAGEAAMDALLRWAHEGAPR